MSNMVSAVRKVIFFVLKCVHHLKMVVHLEGKMFVLADAIKVTRTARETAGRGGRKNKTCP
jgi:hypothetical protein